MNKVKNKKDYNAECNKILNTLKFMKPKPSLLLHVCCAPCSASVLLKLATVFDVSIFYYNPNILNEAEYTKRGAELEKLLANYKRDFSLTFPIITSKYNHSEFLSVAKGLEAEAEGGKRCEKCHELRLKKTVSTAIDLGFDYFCSTLSISPLKNASLINELGYSLSSEDCKWLPNDFKKENGYLRSTQITQVYELYRQDFCGCEFSRKGINK